MEKTFEHRAEEQPTVEEKPLVDESPAAEESPAPAIEPVAEGVWLVRLPLPWPLAIVNVYLLEQQDGLLLIDCGVKTDESLGVLSQALAILGRTFQDIRQIVVTHMHADHVGAAAELRQRSGAPVLMERTEAKLIAPREPGEQFFVKAERYMREHGVPEELIGRLREMSRKASGVSERLVADGYLDDGDTLPYRGGALEAMVTPGHSPGLLSFLCREQRLLFSSDVILSGITPNIGVHPFYDDNPLDDYLRSLDRLHELDIGLAVAWRPISRTPRMDYRNPRTSRPAPSVRAGGRRGRRVYGFRAGSSHLETEARPDRSASRHGGSAFAPALPAPPRRSGFRAPQRTRPLGIGAPSVSTCIVKFLPIWQKILAEGSEPRAATWREPPGLPRLDSSRRCRTEGQSVA